MARVLLPLLAAGCALLSEPKAPADGPARDSASPDTGAPVPGAASAVPTFSTAVPVAIFAVQSGFQ